MRKTETTTKKNLEVPLHLKYTLTIEEAAAYTGIGQYRIAQLLKDPYCTFGLLVGDGRGKYLVKRKSFEEFLEAEVRIQERILEKKELM